jgi:hypothetical protein
VTKLHLGFIWFLLGCSTFSYSFGMSSNVTSVLAPVSISEAFPNFMAMVLHGCSLKSNFAQILTSAHRGVSDFKTSYRTSEGGSYVTNVRRNASFFPFSEKTPPLFASSGFLVAGRGKVWSEI